MTEPTEFTIEAIVLRRALTTALAFTDRTGTWPALENVQVKVIDDGIEFAATDRYTLYWEHVKVTGEPYGLLIPAHIARRLLTMVPKGTARKPVMGMVSFARVEGRVTARFLGEFEEFETSITFTPPEFDGFPDYQKMLDGWSEIDPKTYAHEVHLSPHFMARVSRAITARGHIVEPIRISFLTAHKPVVLHGPDGFNAIIMPVRTGGAS
ncbi:hypothetical protein [Actinomadura rupiterrae]|uniref:hypothetical protein n=1 Tax=Actinomadura rupiterrae TaxID=559627 RepID=UPI0020A4E981|nr:hypothetical protein [Actinomadura rupiterrae]MCP2339210.1 hypothetical protein [Actinomadura rupiterrae]